MFFLLPHSVFISNLLSSLSALSTGLACQYSQLRVCVLHVQLYRRLWEIMQCHVAGEAKECTDMTVSETVCMPHARKHVFDQGGRTELSSPEMTQGQQIFSSLAGRGEETLLLTSQ